MHSRFFCRLVRPAGAWTAVALGLFICAAGAEARSFIYENITDGSGGPGQGNAPSINQSGDIAFYQGTSTYFYDRSEGTFLNVTSLPGAPSEAWFPKLNGLGNIVMTEPSTRNLWLFEADSETFTNISALPGYPGNSQAHGWQLVFDLNDANKVSFHSGDRNYGQVYVYDHATQSFEAITGKPGGSSHGRENSINNAGQVAYMGFPSVYLYDPATGTTTDINNLPGGPGGLGDSFALNDRGDIAIFRPDAVTYYEASSGSFLYLATLPGFPAGSASSYGNDLSNRGGISFWRTDLYYFDPIDRSFTRLNNNPSVPVGGMTTSINADGLIAMAAGLTSIEDIYLAVPLSRADFDNDGDVDWADLTVFQDCATGPGIPYGPESLAPGCTLEPDDRERIAADFDNDSDVDQSDFGIFQRCYSDESPADPTCDQ
ncbi:MAG: hypothetical protein GX616_07575 [Planctomycetes bacterium]|nr:hypothetical protein [Planctomycetota bacterium]